MPLLEINFFFELSDLKIHQIHLNKSEMIHHSEASALSVSMVPGKVEFKSL